MITLALPKGSNCSLGPNGGRYCASRRTASRPPKAFSKLAIYHWLQASCSRFHLSTLGVGLSKGLQTLTILTIGTDGQTRRFKYLSGLHSRTIQKFILKSLS